MSNTKEYKTWSGIKKRCENPKASNWHQYGGAGVTICKKWKDSFLTFYEDMGPAPSEYHSIDRIDNSKGYCKENCRWATAKQQARNKTNNRKIEIAGKSKTIAEWILRRRKLNQWEMLMWKQIRDTLMPTPVKDTSKDGEPRIAQVIRFYDVEERDAKVLELNEECTRIDGALEIINAVTDLIE